MATKIHGHENLPPIRNVTRRVNREIMSMGQAAQDPQPYRRSALSSTPIMFAHPACRHVVSRRLLEGSVREDSSRLKIYCPTFDPVPRRRERTLKKRCEASLSAPSVGAPDRRPFAGPPESKIGVPGVWDREGSPAILAFVLWTRGKVHSFSRLSTAVASLALFSSIAPVRNADVDPG